MPNRTLEEIRNETDKVWNETLDVMDRIQASFTDPILAAGSEDGKLFQELIQKHQVLTMEAFKMALKGEG